MKTRWFLWGILASAACSLPENTAETGLHTPSRTTFPLVADALQPSCGSLDCHGQKGRNLRLYGGRGLRLDAKGNSADEPTSDAEYAASFRSLTALEPEALDAVVTSAGYDFERLTIVRKARNTERHKGGQQMIPGDALDRCLVYWLTGRSDLEYCTRVANAPRPYLDVPASMNAEKESL